MESVEALMAAGRAQGLGQQVRVRELTMALYAAATLNGFAVDMASGIARFSAGYPVAGVLGIDPVVLLAAMVGLTLCWRADDLPSRGGDWLAAGAAAMVVMLPHADAGWVAAALLGLQAQFADRRQPELRAAGWVFIAISVHQVWGQIAINILTPVLAAGDAALVALVLGLMRDGVSRSGSIVATGAGYEVIIVAACLSLRAVLMALLCSVAFLRLVRPDWRLRDAVVLLVVGGIATLFNVGRLALCGVSVEAYHTLHGTTAQAGFEAMVVAAALAVSFAGVRHDFRPRRTVG